MKKFLLSILLIAAIGTAASAQAFKRGDNLIGVQVGFAGLPSTTYGVFWETGVVDGLLGSENIALGLGINAAYYGYENKATIERVNYKYENSDYLFNGRLALHFSFSDRIESYIGGNLGFTYHEVKASSVGKGSESYAKQTSKPKFVYGGVLGLRCRLGSMFSLGVEGGIGKANSTVAICAAFAF